MMASIGRLLVLCTLLFNTRSAGGAPGPEPSQRLYLCAETNTYLFENAEYDWFLADLERAVDEYDIDEVMLHHFNMVEWVDWSAFDRLDTAPADSGRITRLRSQLQRFREKGVKITISGGGPDLPPGFLDAYPEYRDITNGLFAKLIEDKTAELFSVIPEMDSYEVYLWETPLLNDSNYFGDFYWAKSYQEAILTVGYRSPADFLTEFFAASIRGAERAGKTFTLLTFSHYPFQERLIIDALGELDHTLPLRLDHKCQPGDWAPFRGPNTVMTTVTGRPGMILFDGAGEYWGQTKTPCCYPEEIARRLRHAVETNHSITGAGMRISWVNGISIFGTFNEINWYALSRLRDNPYLPVDDIWREWAAARFGEQAADTVISALKRTDDIVRNTYYIYGAWIHNHSAISNLPYLESHVVNYAKSHIRWFPDDLEARDRLRELIERPDEGTIAWVRADRQKALHMNAISHREIESARQYIPPDEYENLDRQFTLQRHFIEASIPHIEAFIRYRIEKQNPSKQNRDALETALAGLAEKADEIERVYGDSEPFLRPELIRTYIDQIRTAVGGK